MIVYELIGNAWFDNAMRMKWTGHEKLTRREWNRDDNCEKMIE